MRTLARDPAPQRRPSLRPACEPLEPRRLLSVDLLSDVNPSTADGLPESSRFSGNVLVSNGIAYFVATADNSSTQMWRTDGTAAGTFALQDIKPGLPDSTPANLTDVNGTVYFRVGSRTWRTDGTKAGTTETDPIPLQYAVVVGQRIFALGYDEAHGAEPWVTDAAGPRRLADTVPGPASSNILSFTPAGDRVYFTTFANGHTLWTSDGTPEGTVALLSTPGAGGIGSLAAVNGTLYFFASGTTPAGLWKTDGTPQGTVPVAAGTPGADPVAFGDVLLFVRGNEVWRSDGTAAGTFALKSFDPADTRPFLYWSKTYKGHHYFSAGDAVSGHELWRTDGTPQGTTLVREINPTPHRGSGPNLFTVVGDTLYFTASDGVTGNEWWKTDGTAAGTTLVKDIAPGPAPGDNDPVHGRPHRLSDTTFVFVTDDGVHGTELWRSDGTAAGTSLVADLNRAPLSSSPTHLTRVGDQVFFVATTASPRLGDDAVSDGLWKTDGTPGGTTLVTNAVVPHVKPPPDPFTLPLERTILADVNGTLYFAGSGPVPFRPHPGTELWKSNGTAGGTTLVADIHPTDGSYPKSLTNVNGTLYFVANHPTSGWELWKSNGTAANTQLVKDIFPGAGAPGIAVASPGAGHGAEVYAPTSLTNVNGTLYFVANDGTGWDLWKSNGTGAGTVKVADLSAPVPESFYDVTAFNGQLYFSMYDAAGRTLWRSDGTPGGTGPVLSHRGNPVRQWLARAVAGGYLYFFGDDQDPDVRDLWRTDGTAAGTVRTADLPPAISGPYSLMASGNSVYFIHNESRVNGDSFYKLWKSNGTPAGTAVVATNVPPIGASASAGGTLFFAARTRENGYELWQTDGTSAGTFMNREIVPGPDTYHPLTGRRNVAPSQLVSLTDKVVFVAEDIAHGVELWSAAPSPPPNAVVGQYLFYNRSVYDGGTAGPDAADDGAIATRFVYGVHAVNPGQLAMEGSSHHFSTYARGINGIMVDVAGLPAGNGLNADDFTFRTGNGPDVSTWASGPTPSSVTVRRGAGVGGSDRVTLIWPDHATAPEGQAAVANAWLEVTIKAGPRTALPRPHTFYYGNLIGDGYDFRNERATVNATDFFWSRRYLGRPVDPNSSSNLSDFNRNGVFDVGDLAAVRANLGRRLLPFVAPAAPGAPAPAAPASNNSTAPPAPRRRSAYQPAPATSILTS